MKPFTQADLKGLGLASDEIEFVERMHRGGAAGGAGTHYEDDYAVYRLVEATPVYLRTGEDFGVRLQDFCPVDDAVCLKGGADCREYCQLKSGQADTWGANSGKIERQFRLQKRICDAARIKEYRLLLITPHADRKASFDSNMPADLKGCTRVDLVKLEGKPWAEGHTTCTHLKSLCAVDPSSSSQRESIAAYYVNRVANLEGDEVCWVSEVVNRIREDPGVFLCHDRATLPPAWKDVEASLSSIPTLVIRIQRGFCFYECGFLSGVIARCDTESLARFAERVIESQPKTVKDFLRILP